MLIRYFSCGRYRCLFYPILYTLIITVNGCQAATINKRKADGMRYVLPRDAIPAIKSPEFVSTHKSRLDDNEPIIGISMNGQSRAYSVYILNHHEIVNDKIGNKKFAVTWCPLANLAVVYDREIGGKAYTFGVTGKLLKNTLVMFDYETGSIWPALFGEAVEGPLSGTKLKRELEGQKVLWGIWRKLYPDTLVLQYNGIQTVGYDAYRHYHKGDQRGIFPMENVDDRLGSKTNVIGVEEKGCHKAYRPQCV
ncbi:MAG: DUF3179 domain-containing protein [Planctomycetes bacterium]|nr:DUF3179 domain-containing protein [Planctomycetota bacterium]